MQTKLYLLASFLFLLMVPGFSQTAYIYGTVNERNGQALPGATIVADVARGLATLSDSAGAYSLMLPAGQYQLVYRYIGKQEYTVKLQVAAGDTVKWDVTLSDNTRIVDEVVVTGSRYGKKLGEESVSMTVVKGALLTQQNMTGVDQVMNRIPGVTIADGQVNIRGGSGWSYGAGSRVQVLMDDLPILTSDAADAKWSIVPVENVEQLEVIKGAASALYGSGALNGIINARTAWPTDEPYAKVIVYTGITGPPTRTPAMQWWGSNAPMNGGASFAYRQKYGQNDLVMGGAYNAGTGYLDSSDSHSMRYNVKYRHRFKKVPGLNVGLNASIYYSWGKTFFLWRGIDSFGYKPYPGTISVFNSYRATIDPFINYSDDKGNTFRFLGRFFNAFNGTNNNQGSVPNRYYTEVQYLHRFNFKAFDFNLIGGLVNVYDNISPPKAATGSLFGKNTQYNFSAYAQTDFKFFKRLNISIGARWEYFNMQHYERDSSQVQRVVNRQNSLKDLPYPLARIGLNYQAAEATFIRASFGQGFRYPSIAERYVSTAVGPLTIASNPQLGPERGYNAELGVKQGFKIGKTWTGYVDVSGFWNQYENMMEFTFGQFGDTAIIKAGDLGLGFSSQNVGKTRILGTELELGGTGMLGPVSLQFLAGYTFTDPRSLNWNDEIKLYNYQGVQLKPYGEVYFNGQPAGQVELFNAANYPAGTAPGTFPPYITYAMTSSSTSNVLKYRNRHTFKLDIRLEWKGIEWNTNVQFASFMQNIDYAFVSQAFKTISPEAFGGLEQYRNTKAATPIGKGRGDVNWNMYLAYNFKPGVRIAFLVNNLLNWESTTRPAYFDSPRNYTVQMSYTFSGKKKG